jgi:hypothetical protein
MSRQNRLPHHPGKLLRRQQRAGVNEFHGYEVLPLAFLLSPNFPGVGTLSPKRMMPFNESWRTC